MMIKDCAVILPETTGPARLAEPFRKWNQTATPYPREKTVAQLFEDIAAAYPERLAVVCGRERLTYHQLNRRANRLAWRLRSLGVQPEMMVGCCVERSVELIVALLGILKAGGAFVPLDASYPKERLSTLLADTFTPFIVTRKPLVPTLPYGESRQVLVDDVEADAADENPPSATGPANLAYVMFTSGSTGRPKGVMVENRAIVRLVRNTNFCRFEDEVFLHFAPVSFDAATFEIWGPLLNGSRLVVAPHGVTSIADLGQTVCEQGVTTLWLTAGLFHLMVEQRLDDLRSIRQLLAGGDVLSAPHIRMALEKLPQACVINGYGPTENTTFTCCHQICPQDKVPDSVPIGRPISNTRVYILDEHMKTVDPGETGELWAAGDGVARGYWNDPETTAEKFRSDTFSSDPEARMYRTGDLARWREDGVIEFLGRVDNQVKIRGYRIEPGEVETYLVNHPDVTQCCVVAHGGENGSKRLIGYYVPRENFLLGAPRLREFLEPKLPAHMIPAIFVPLAALPLSPNGKVDRAALASRDLPHADQGGGDGPSNRFEVTVCEVWQRILRLESVGLNDNFFDLGGDSLLLLAVHANLQKILNMQIPVMHLFEYPTVKSLAGRLAGDGPGSPLHDHARQQGQKQRQAFANFQQRRTGSRA